MLHTHAADTRFLTPRQAPNNLLSCFFSFPVDLPSFTRYLFFFLFYYTYYTNSGRMHALAISLIEFKSNNYRTVEYLHQGSGQHSKVFLSEKCLFSMFRENRYLFSNITARGRFKKIYTVF